MKRKQLMMALMTVIMIVSLLPMYSAKANESSAAELITHYTMVKEGNKLTDVTGNKHDATLVGFTDSDITKEADGTNILTFPGDKSKYVKLPNGAIGEDETFTIEATFYTSTKTNHWLYCLGTKTGSWPNVTNYVFVNPLQGGGTIRYGIKDSSKELLNQTGSIDTTSYNTITAVFSEGKINIYLNAALVGTITHTYSVQTILKDGVTDVNDCIGYIGKSLYNSDAAFTGKLKDFKVYNYALTAEEIEENAIPVLSDEEIVALAKINLSIPNADNIRGNITLPNTSKEGAAITWSSTNTKVIGVTKEENVDYDSTPAGVVTRQNTDVTVTLTATITSGLVTDTKTFNVKVVKKPEVIQDADYTDYLFTHFIGEHGNTGEQIYFSLSQDGLNWNDLNNGEVVLTSNLGDGGVRDPFIVRSYDGDKFYLIATDLCIGGGTTWTQAQNSGSKSLIIWESNDLVNWSDPRSVEVGVEGAGCVWAPEAIYDEKTGEYIVYWASKIQLDGDTFAKHRIYYAKTRDFYSFTKPQIYLERPNHIIDTTMTYYNGSYYRYSKDETSKVINVDSSSQLLNSTWTTIDSELLGGLYGVEGPLIYKLNEDDATQNTWCLMVDQFASGRGYLPLITNNLSAGVFTEVTGYDLGDNLKRHGCVLRLTSAEYENLQKAYSPTLVNETVQESPVISYDFDESLSEGTIKDISGNNSNGKLYGNASYVIDSNTGSQVLYLDGTNGTYAEFPNGFFTGKNTFTISMDIKSQTTAANFFTWAVGKDNNKYMFLRTRSTQIRNAITKSSYNSEHVAVATVDSILDKWIHVTIVVTDTSMKVYQNGELIANNDAVGTSISDLGNDLVSYLGKSFYSADAYFKGYFDNIKVYNRALTEVEIAQKNGVEFTPLKNVTADGYQIKSSKSDLENHVLNLYFSKSNSTNTDLSLVNLEFDLAEGCTLKTDISKGVDLTEEGVNVEINIPGEATPKTWTLKGTWCNNPVLGGEYADPDIHVFDGTYYIYPTTDGFTSWSGTEFHVFTSTDLVNWEDNGIILDVTKDVDWSVGSAWAPTTEEKDGKYYFYFCAKNKAGTSCIGVAVSDSPTGPFVAESEPLLTPTICSGIKMGQTIDPYVYTEDDGTSYLLFGNGNPAVVKLNDDMISIDSSTMKNLTGLTDFRESVVVNKRNGIYHFTWSCDDTGSENYHVNYGTSNSIYGPVTYQYTVLQKDLDNDILGTGHQSIIKNPDKDEYYIAYHRFYMPLGEYTSGLGYHRETCIDKVTFDAETGLMNVITPTLEGISLDLSSSSN